MLQMLNVTRHKGMKSTLNWFCFLQDMFFNFNSLSCQTERNLWQSVYGDVYLFSSIDLASLCKIQEIISGSFNFITFLIIIRTSSHAFSDSLGLQFGSVQFRLGCFVVLKDFPAIRKDECIIQWKWIIMPAVITVYNGTEGTVSVTGNCPRKIRPTVQQNHKKSGQKHWMFLSPFALHRAAKKLKHLFVCFDILLSCRPVCLFWCLS